MLRDLFTDLLFAKPIRLPLLAEMKHKDVPHHGRKLRIALQKRWQDVGRPELIVAAFWIAFEKPDPSTPTGLRFLWSQEDEELCWHAVARTDLPGVGTIEHFSALTVPEHPQRFVFGRFDMPAQTASVGQTVTVVASGLPVSGVEQRPSATRHSFPAARHDVRTFSLGGFQKLHPLPGETPRIL